MDTRVLESMDHRTEKGTKCPESMRPHSTNQLVRMRSPVQIRIAAPKSLENFGFQGFFVANFDFLVWVKMWVNQLTHTVTHTPKWPEKSKQCRAGNLRFLPGFFSLPYMTCSMKLPMVAAASSCFCRVAWV